ncbi:MAG: phage/plasmid primase, P4 family [Gallionellaceae bacterium]
MNKLIDNSMVATRQIDIAEAARFLKSLDPHTDQFTFQTFDDEKELKTPSMARIFHGTLEQHASTLVELNQKGAGIFVTVNKTDMQGRKAENVVAVRRFFVDTDGAPLQQIANAFLEGEVLPSCIVESSPGNFHVYWIATCELHSFRQVQSALAEKFGTDTSVYDLPRVMRLPGFYHQKRKNGVYVNECGAVLVRIRAANENAIAYTPDQIIQRLGLSPPQAVAPSMALNDAVAAALKSPPPQETPQEVERVKSMLAAIPADCDRATWRNIIWAVADTGWACAEELARQWSMTAPELYNESDFIREWNSFDPKRAGGIKFGTLDYHAKLHGWVDHTPEERFTGNGADVANGRIFASVWRGQLLFVHETGDVLTFAQQGWISAPPGEADRAAKDVLAKLRDKAAELYKTAPEDPKTKRIMAHVERTSKAPNLRAMIEMSKSEPGMTRSLNEFDADPMLLGVANGVLDLRTGALLPVSPDLLVSMRCPVDYDSEAKCPLFLNYLGVTHPDGEMRKFLQRMMGYCLTGITQEQKFAFLYGLGANGKSVFVELIAWILGDYARKIATEMLMHHQRSPQGPSPDIVALKGRRFVYASETEEGRRLAESRVKDMTGGDTLTGRVPYGKADITFQPTHKLVIVGNHRPEITDTSFGMWRRVLLVPFDVTIAEADRDQQLLEKLKSEGPGILNWMLDGLRQWQRHGLMVPKKIEGATAAYRDEMDIIGDWINEHCESGAGCTVYKRDAYRAYHTWALSNGHHPLAQNRLTRRLNERGYKVQADKRTIGGLKLGVMGVRAAGDSKLT